MFPDLRPLAPQRREALKTQGLASAAQCLAGDNLDSSKLYGRSANQPPPCLIIVQEKILDNGAARI